MLYETTLTNEIGITEEERKERNIKFHSLRHAYVTKMESGLSLLNAQKLIRHADSKTTRIYSHETKETRAKSVQLIDNLYGLDSPKTDIEEEESKQVK